MSKCSFNPLFIFSGLTRNRSLFSVSSGDKHLKSHDISIDFASTGLLTFTCGYLFLVQISLWALFISPREAYLNPVSGFLSPVLEHPLCAFCGTPYLILPITCVFVNEKVEFTWLTQDDIPRERFVPGIEPRHQPLFVMPGCLGSCGFLNNLFWCLYLWNSIGCQKSTVAKALCL